MYIRNSYITWFHFNDFKEINEILDTLQPNKPYIMSFDLIIDRLGFQLGDPSIILGKPILISKDSNPWLISNYLKERIRLACDRYALDESWLELGNDGPGVLVKYKEITIFAK